MKKQKQNEADEAVQDEADYAEQIKFTRRYYKSSGTIKRKAH